jgi:hypothetical protein
MVVDRNSISSRVEFVVAGRRYVPRTNKYEYQLKVSDGSQTPYEDGKWFKESVLSDA